MRISIIIPTKDRGRIFDATLTAAAAATEHINAEIVVVNDSQSPLPSIAHSRVKVMSTGGRGVASARNLGAGATSGDILLFMDDDIVISRRSIEHVMRLHADHPNACFNLDWSYPDALQRQLHLTQFGRYLERHNFTSFKGWYNHSSWQDAALFPSLSVASFHLSIRADAFLKTGGYDERFPFAGFEDHDFPKRIKKAGIATYIDTRVSVFHNEEDRLVMANWLAAQQRRAATRRLAVEVGYQEIALQFGPVKSVMLKTIAGMTPILSWMLSAIPNRTLFDPLFSKLVSIILAGKIYSGYTTKLA